MGAVVADATYALITGDGIAISGEVLDNETRESVNA